MENYSFPAVPGNLQTLLILKYYFFFLTQTGKNIAMPTSLSIAPAKLDISKSDVKCLGQHKSELQSLWVASYSVGLFSARWACLQSAGIKKKEQVFLDLLLIWKHRVLCFLFVCLEFVLFVCFHFCPLSKYRSNAGRFLSI